MLWKTILSLIYMQFHVLVLFRNSIHLKICFDNKNNKTLLVSVVALSVFSKRRPSWQNCVSFLSSWPCVWNRTPLPSFCLCVGSSCGLLGSGGAALMSWALCDPPGALPVWHWMGILQPELHRLCSAATATTHAPAPGKGWWSQTAAEDRTQDLRLSAGQNGAVWSETPRVDRILQEVKFWLHWFLLKCCRAACIQLNDWIVLGTLYNIHTEQKFKKVLLEAETEICISSKKQKCRNDLKRWTLRHWLLKFLLFLKQCLGKIYQNF